MTHRLLHSIVISVAIVAVAFTVIFPAFHAVNEALESANASIFAAQ